VEKERRLSYKYRIYPNKEQRRYFAVNFGCCRYVYNHFLNQRIEAYRRTQATLRRPVRDEEGKPVRNEKGKMVFEENANPDYDPAAKPMSFFDTSKALTALKKSTVDEEGHKWLYDADANALVYSLRNLEAAYQAFFRRVKSGAGKAGFPRFKSRKSRQSFKVAKCEVMENRLSIPKCTPIKAKIDRMPDGEIVSATISRNAAGQYFCAVNVKEAALPDAPPAETEVGITMGITPWVVTTDGETFDRPNADGKLAKKLAREQRRLSRKKPGSANYAKQRLKVARVQNRIANVRWYKTHSLTRELVDEHGTIASRNMGSQDMVKHKGKATRDLPKKVQRRMNQAIADGNFAEVNRQLAYKSEWAGRAFVELPQDAPTAQVCSKCGHRHTILAKDLRSEWTCPSCGAVHSRKLNGAVNVLEAGRDILFEQESAYVTKAMEAARKAREEGQG